MPIPGRRKEEEKPDEAPAEPDPFNESAKVERWRLHVLEEAGYPFAIAQRIAMSREVDLHVACEILKGGCAPEVAAEILL